MNDDSPPSMKVSARPRRSWWFPISIALLVFFFLLIVVERGRIRAHWWAHRLTRSESLQDRGYYLALLAGDTESAGIGYRALCDDQDADLRCMAVYLMESCPSEASSMAMGRLLDDSSQSVRDAAAIGLAFRGAQYGALEQLRTAIRLRGSSNRAAAAAAGLARVTGSLSCRDLVWALARHPAALVRAQAAESLGSLLLAAEAPADAAVGVPGGDPREAGVVLAADGSPCDIIKALVEALNDQEPFEGRLALEREVQSVTAFATASGRPATAEFAGDPEKSRTVAQIAASILSQLSGCEIEFPERGDAQETSRLLEACRKGYHSRKRSSASAPASDPVEPSD